MKLGTTLLLIFKYLLFLLVVAYLGFALVRFVRPAEDLVCTGVKVELERDSVLSLVDEAYVLNLLGQHKISPKGRSFKDIDKEAINRLLDKSPHWDTAYCYRNSAAELVVCAKVVKPVLHVFTDGGEEFYLGQDGRVLPLTGHNPELCVATGAITHAFAARQLTPLANLILESGFWRLQVQQIHVDSQGRLWLTTRLGEKELLLGDASNLEDKLERLRLFFVKGLPKAGWNTYERVDASFDGQLVCVKRQQTK